MEGAMAPARSPLARLPAVTPGRLYKFRGSKYIQYKFRGSKYIRYKFRGSKILRFYLLLVYLRELEGIIPYLEFFSINYLVGQI
jgi:hypothetical protein